MTPEAQRIAIAEALKAASAGTAPESGAAPLVGTGSMVGFRSLTLFCVAQGGMAAVMFALGIVGIETLSAAIYWPSMTLLGAWLLRREPNTPVTHDGAKPRSCV